MWLQRLQQLSQRPFSTTLAAAMAKSKYEYVKDFESNTRLLPNTWVVVRIDGKGFHDFTKAHGFAKPNDAAALQLMNHAATAVMTEFDDLTLAYGQSDEYSFLFRRATDLYSRREAKLASVIGSTFTAHYAFAWHQYFPQLPLRKPPAFDARAVAYPALANVRDYFSWRQADCHINNLYNTTFWALVLKGGMTEVQAMERLKGTRAKDKNEILFTDYGINYANEPEMFRKGTTLYRGTERIEKESVIPAKFAIASRPVLRTEGDTVVQLVERDRPVVKSTTEDIIGDAFWDEHPSVLSD
ncbi:tRNAHis guanylyltransferase [Blastocladiella britannica]|nr:tRNAHis guanylyltransferase [Blastocladiella britannica]